MWAPFSNRFIAVWRNTVAIEFSMFSASSVSREAGVSAASSRRWNTSVSPNTEAVSQTVSGVCCSKMPRGMASAAWTPCPSSCASVITSRRLAVQLSITYGCTLGTVYAQNAPPRLPGRTGASIQRSSKNRLTRSPSWGEKSA